MDLFGAACAGRSAQGLRGRALRRRAKISVAVRRSRQRGSRAEALYQLGRLHRGRHPYSLRRPGQPNDHSFLRPSRTSPATTVTDWRAVGACRIAFKMPWHGRPHSGLPRAGPEGDRGRHGRNPERRGREGVRENRLVPARSDQPAPCRGRGTSTDVGSCRYSVREVEMEELSRALEADAGPAVDQTGPLQSWHGTTVQAPDLSSWGRQHYSLMPICECQATNGYSIANRCFIAPLPTLGVLEADACAWNPGQGLRLSRDLSHEDGMCHPTC